MAAPAAQKSFEYAATHINVRTILDPAYSDEANRANNATYVHQAAQQQFQDDVIKQFEEMGKALEGEDDRLESVFYPESNVLVLRSGPRELLFFELEFHEPAWPERGAYRTLAGGNDAVDIRMYRDRREASSLLFQHREDSGRAADDFGMLHRSDQLKCKAAHYRARDGLALRAQAQDAENKEESVFENLAKRGLKVIRDALPAVTRQPSVPAALPELQAA